MEGSGVRFLIPGECFVSLASKSCEETVNVMFVKKKLPITVVQLEENQEAACPLSCRPGRGVQSPIARSHRPHSLQPLKTLCVSWIHCQTIYWRSVSQHQFFLKIEKRKTECTPLITAYRWQPLLASLVLLFWRCSLTFYCEVTSCDQIKTKTGWFHSFHLKQFLFLIKNKHLKLKHPKSKIQIFPPYLYCYLSVCIVLVFWRYLLSLQ